jgi:fumarylacetoacetate (FAA) hydrolase
MKLATLRNNARDGQLLVVNKALTTAVDASDIAPTLQFALDNWVECQPKLQALYEKLNAGQINNTLEFNQLTLSAPLPRAYQWADGSAYVNHIELVRKARGAEMPDNFWHEPLMYQGGSDTFLGPRDAIPLKDEKWGLDFESEVAVITRDVPLGVSAAGANKYICLIMLVNDV